MPVGLTVNQELLRFFSWLTITYHALFQLSRGWKGRWYNV